MTRRAHLRRRARRIRHGVARRNAHGSRRRRIAGLVVRELDRMNRREPAPFNRAVISIEGFGRSLIGFAKTARKVARAIERFASSGSNALILPPGAKLEHLR
jgi:hypothetical protein